MSVQILRGNALALPLDDNTVDLVVTSPPYFALRSYQDAGEHYDGQIGSEATPVEFVDALIAATAEMVRVVKPSGSIWVNLGDKYAGAGQPIGYNKNGSTGGVGPKMPTTSGIGALINNEGIRAKSLIGVPWRYALRCIDDLGLILRAEVIWSKPNGLPESVTDRVRRSHETWFHFTLNPRYYSAVDEIREEHAPGTHQRRLDGAPSPKQAAGLANGTRRGYMPETYTNPLGKLPGSVWTIPTQPLTVPPELGVDHFAAFPMEFPRRIVTGWSPREVCTACGEGRRPTSESRITADRGGRQFNPASGNIGVLGKERVYAIIGYACACPTPTTPVTIREFDHITEQMVDRTVERPDPDWVNPAPTTPGTVLDPFGGTGTTALVAHALGRHGISVDMSADYCRLAAWRTSDPKELARAQQREYTPPREQVDGQETLFEGLGA